MTLEQALRQILEERRGRGERDLYECLLAARPQHGEHAIHRRVGIPLEPLDDFAPLDEQATLLQPQPTGGTPKSAPAGPGGSSGRPTGGPSRPSAPAPRGRSPQATRNRRPHSCCGAPRGPAKAGRPGAFSTSGAQPPVQRFEHGDESLRAGLVGTVELDPQAGHSGAPGAGNHGYRARGSRRPAAAPGGPWPERSRGREPTAKALPWPGRGLSGST